MTDKLNSDVNHVTKKRTENTGKEQEEEEEDRGIVSCAKI